LKGDAKEAEVEEKAAVNLEKHTRFLEAIVTQHQVIGLAIPAGLEPATNSLEGCCSIQLSYGTGWRFL